MIINTPYQYPRLVQLLLGEFLQMSEIFKFSLIMLKLIHKHGRMGKAVLRELKARPYTLGRSPMSLRHDNGMEQVVYVGSHSEGSCE